jgi:quercetin dioxygenase-like cupin family protein
MLDKEIDIPKTGQKLILVHGTIEPGGSAGEHTHQGSEMRLLLAGSLTMTMPEKTVTYRKGQYFFEPAHTHMTKVEGDRSTPTEFIIFEVGTATDVDSVYHPES